MLTSLVALLVELRDSRRSSGLPRDCRVPRRHLMFTRTGDATDGCSRRSEDPEPSEGSRSALLLLSAAPEPGNHLRHGGTHRPGARLPNGQSQTGILFRNGFPGRAPFVDMLRIMHLDRRWSRAADSAATHRPERAHRTPLHRGCRRRTKRTTGGAAGAHRSRQIGGDGAPAGGGGGPELDGVALALVDLRSHRTLGWWSTSALDCAPVMPIGARRTGWSTSFGRDVLARRSPSAVGARRAGCRGP
jgi:hypothetical protein